MTFKGITPQQVQEVLNNKVDKAKIQQIVEDINTKMSNHEWVRDWVRNKEVNPTWAFPFGHSLTISEKQIIKTVFLEAGWGAVEVTNSEDSGERPGMCNVTLRMKKL